MTEQLRRGGWVYVLHHDDDVELAQNIKLGLNRLGHQVWVRERDAPDEDDLKSHNIGIERAGFVIVLETAALKRWRFAHELVEWAEAVCMKFPQTIRVEVDRDCEVTSKGFVVPMRAPLRRLVYDIHLAIRKFDKRARPASTDLGSRGRYVLLSYASSDADKAAAVREGLAPLRVAAWDYAVSARQPTIGHEVEIPAVIEKAKAVLIVLTAAWLKSDYCGGELDHARKSNRRCLWLRFEHVAPRGDYEPRDLVEFRGANGYDKGFAQLAHTLNTRRRR